MSVIEDEDDANRVSEGQQTTSGLPENKSQNKIRKPPQAFIDAQWKPGESGNPGGRPVNFLKPEILKQTDAETLREIIAAQIEKAKAGDEKALRFLAEYAIGKPGMAQEDREALEKAGGGSDALAVILGLKK